ncbi:MAG: hypothetical protein ACRC33_11480 [Gemmataceae bacterium]
MSIRMAALAAVLAAATLAPRAAAAPYAQLSSSESQTAVDSGKLVTLNSTDAAKDIDNKNGAVTIKEAGVYFAIAAAQIGGKGKGTVKLWMRQNGKDVDNSNTEQTVADGTTSVLVCQGVGEFKAGDKLELFFSASSSDLGLVASKPKGEPGIPSMILSVFKVDPSNFAQLSSGDTQPAGETPKAITLNSTDAAKGIENKGGEVTIKEPGVYFAIAAGQIGATAAGGKGTVKLWMRQNGKDIDNSNTEQTVSGTTSVLVCQGVGEFKAGDKIELAQSCTGTGVGMLASKPKGEPAIPSMILSVFKVSSKSFAQLSSAKTQEAAAEPKAVATESTDAAGGIENKAGSVTLKEGGFYFAIAAGQVGGTGKGAVKLWMRQNGKDIDNSNTEQTVSGTTSVLVCQGVGEFKAGDKIELAQSCTGTGVGMLASKPKGEPAIPSMILSIFKID